MEKGQKSIREFMSKNGKKGGKSLFKKYGSDHMRKIGAKGGRKSKRIKSK